MQQQIKEAHDAYMGSLFEDDDGNPAKSFYRAIKAKRRDQVGVSALRASKKGKMESSTKGKARILNNQYSSVFKSDAGKKIPGVHGPRFGKMKGIKVLLVLKRSSRS